MKKIIYIFLFLFFNLTSFASEDYKLSEITDGNENAKIKLYVYEYCILFQ